ncbi:unnamed protein product [Cylicocyclus nassatus]|uniref:Uncharacterized protein n=1 Tax=Cylicocyclus nassatus TaxID=53992 RepID=A0AA36HH57_CYLNA|nr:unnamed protein product [Cylicocyclus nassatus]
MKRVARFHRASFARETFGRQKRNSVGGEVDYGFPTGSIECPRQWETASESNARGNPEERKWRGGKSDASRKKRQVLLHCFGPVITVVVVIRDIRGIGRKVAQYEYQKI